MTPVDHHRTPDVPVWRKHTSLTSRSSNGVPPDVGEDLHAAFTQNARLARLSHRMPGGNNQETHSHNARTKGVTQEACAHVMERDTAIGLRVPFPDSSIQSLPRFSPQQTRTHARAGTRTRVHPQARHSRRACGLAYMHPTARTHRLAGRVAVGCTRGHAHAH